MGYRDNDDDGFPWWATLILLLLGFVLMGWYYSSRYESCMEEKHDKILCEIYARPNW